MMEEGRISTTGAGAIEDARAFADEQWNTVLADLERLVRIDSSEDMTTATHGAPFGTGVREALDEAMRMARGYGFEPQECDGQCGFFHVAGASERQLAIMGHLDVVPAGNGWTFPPFELTKRDGYLVGRGTTDDKGPLMCAFHALRFWHDRFAAAGEQLPVSVRFIFGCSEETGMADADYYLEHVGAPDFLVTPDADFPLCYGEKGQFQVRVKSAPVADGSILELSAGTAMNGVPDRAEALVRGDAESFEPAKHVSVQAGGEPGTMRVRATGIAGHAAMPEGSMNALHELVSYLLGNVRIEGAERAWLEFVERASASTDGSSLDIACSDDDFGPLTCVASMASFEDGVFEQCVDIRFPTTASIESLGNALSEHVAAIGAKVEVVNAVEPLLVAPDSPQVQALGRAYQTVTGCEARLFTMGGGTYAHHFPVAVSFGAMDEARYPNPEWLGGMHAADEGVAEQCLKDALVIYIVALGELFALDWS